MSYSIEMVHGEPGFWIVSHFRHHINEPGWVVEELDNIVFLPENEWTCERLEGKSRLGYTGDRIFRHKERDFTARVAWIMVACIAHVTKTDNTWSIEWLTP